MKRYTLIFTFLLCCFRGFAQSIYEDSARNFIQNYVDSHKVVVGKDRDHLHFYPVSNSYRILAKFTRINNGTWFTMETSGPIKKVFRAFGTAEFKIHDTSLTLVIYQSQQLINMAQYQDYLFLPFTDLTSGEQTYAAGRYIDLRIGDVKDDQVLIDFNRAYNPLCAYVKGKYNCPIPPKSNSLPVAILAGEMNYGKEVH